MPNRVTEGGRTFAVTTCQLWNSLSLELRNLVPIESFKNNYRNILFIKSSRNYTISQFDHILAYIFHYPYHDIFHSTNDTIRADLPSKVRSTCNLSVTV